MEPFVNKLAKALYSFNQKKTHTILNLPYFSLAIENTVWNECRGKKTVGCSPHT